MKPSVCPPIPSGLIEYLDTLFPDVCPEPGDDALISYGSVKVVRHLKQKAQEQEENLHVSP